MLNLPEKYKKCSGVLEQQAMPTGNIYHYTNWLSLKGILETQSIWLSDYKYLNDTSEVKYAIKIISDYVLRKCSENMRTPFWEPHFALMEKIAFEFFICSFCERDNYLYAWRSYANDGAGFSIGFKKEFFKSAPIEKDSQISPINNLGKTQNPLLFGRTKIYYNIEELLPSIDELISITEEDLGGIDLLNVTPSSIIEINKTALYFTATLLPYLTSIKHKAYSEEHEYRLYEFADNKNDTQKFFTPGIFAEAPHLSSKKRSYFAFDLSCISEIWIGPRLNFEHAKSDILKILHALKIEGHAVDGIEIIPSGIPYKNFI